MKHWIVTRLADGQVVHRYQAEAAIEWLGMEFATHAHDEEPAPAEPPVPPVEPRRITRLAFLSRFTDAEAIAIDLASQGATTAAAAMRRYMQKVNAATFIDLSRDDTRGGVLALEAAGLLGPGRAMQILDAEIQPLEAWNG